MTQCSGNTDGARIRVMLTDDHPVVREGFAAMIETEPDMTVVGQARSGEEALELFGACAGRDADGPAHAGDGRRRGDPAIRREFPDSRLIVLTTYDGDEDIYRALEAGAQAYLLKDMLCDEILAAIRRCTPASGGSRRRWEPAWWSA